MHLPIVAAVYDRCGRESGNRMARDAARIIRVVAENRVAAYRIGEAAFAFIGPDEPTVRAVLEAIASVVEDVLVTVPRDGEGAPAGAGSIQEFLDRHTRPHGLAVRMQARELASGRVDASEA